MATAWSTPALTRTPRTPRGADGRRLQRLDPDPTTAPHVQRIFAQRLTGRSIARDVNARGVPCPSGADPDRNPHRDHHTWTATTVASILANPRYTGRQVWNRQRTDHHHVDGGQIRVQHWNPTDPWVISTRPAHPALVSAQGYRCRHGHTCATAANNRDQEPYAYVREDELLQNIATTLSPGRGRPPAPAEIPTLLRASRPMIICDHTRRNLTSAPTMHGPAFAVG